MTGEQLTADWTDANQALLGARLAWLRDRLESRLGPSDGVSPATPDTTSVNAIAAAAARMPAPAAIDIVADTFGLSAFERDLLVLCCGVELDAKLGGACARVNGSENQRNPSFGLALATLPAAHWSALTPDRPLRRWHLLEVEPGLRLVDSPLRVDERILHFIAGINHVDARLRPLLDEATEPALMSRSHRQRVAEIVAYLEDGSRPAGCVQLDGDDASGQRDIAASVAAQLGLQLMVVRGEDLPATSVDLELFRVLWEREARLLPALLLVRNGDHAPAHALQTLVETLKSPVLVASREGVKTERASLAVSVDKPTGAEQKGLWLDALGDHARGNDGDLDTLAGQFRLSARTVTAIVDAMDLPADDGGEAVSKYLWQACRRMGRTRLDELAERIEPKASWNDLVLPPAHEGTLRQIAAHLRQRLRVHDNWGFSGQGGRGMGVSALFCGESGTGKTLAAEVLANELDLDLYRIDLSAVVSKYIGETEKNLRRVFDAAEDSGAILLFDEADALFGKRSEVKDSHDRYANIEVSYLLQRMEAYSGLAVLTTNMKAALDRAFQRRLRFIVNFPFPDADLRADIWRRVFPPRAPMVDIDFRKLSRLNLPGGNIRNIALNAAFLAADAGEPVRMSHLLRAAQSESAKLDRPLAEAETRGWT